MYSIAKEPEDSLRGPQWMKNVELDDIVENIKTNQDLKTVINNLRQMFHEGKDSSVSLIKRKLTAFIPSGEFIDSRKGDDIQTYMKTIIIDIDDLASIEVAKTLKESIVDDENCVLAFISPKGQGLKIMYKIANDARELIDIKRVHLSAFIHYQNKYKALGYEIDKSGKDLARLCYLSYDEDAYYNPQATGIDLTLAPTIEYNPIEDLTDDVEDMYNAIKRPTLPEDYYGSMDINFKNHDKLVPVIVKYLVNTKNSITHNYTDWRNMAWALIDVIPNKKDALEYFTALSKLDRNYSDVACINQFTHCINATTPDHSKKITIRSLYYLAIEAGWDFAKTNASNPMTKHQKIELKQKTAMRLLIEANLKLRYDKMLNEVQKYDFNYNYWIQFTDKQLAQTRFKTLYEMYNRADNKDFLESIMPIYDATKDFFQHVPTWDGVSRFRELATMLNAENMESAEMILRIWFTGFINNLKRKRNVDYVHDCILTLTGKQGVRKTSFAKALLPSSFNTYQDSKNIDPKDKDHKFILAENFILNYDEMDNVVNDHKSIEALKTYASTSSVKERRAYGIFKSNMIRVASMCGTINRSNFLKDPTGSRRFWVIKVTDIIDLEQLPNMWQVYAEALHLYNTGAPYWLAGKNLQILEKSNLDFTVESGAEYYVNKYFTVGSHTNYERLMTSNQMIEHITIEEGGKRPFREYHIKDLLEQKMNFKLYQQNNRKGFYIIFKKQPILTIS